MGATNDKHTNEVTIKVKVSDAKFETLIRLFTRNVSNEYYAERIEYMLRKEGITLSLSPEEIASNPSYRKVVTLLLGI